MSSSISDPTEFFSWRGFSIYQTHDVLKVGTDAVLLGSWVRNAVPVAFDILDAGTGTGILALVTSDYYKEANVIAADIDMNAIALAQFNVGKAGFEKRIVVVQADLLDPTSLSSKKFDLIICNPPFYTTRILPIRQHHVTAKHSMVSVSNWMQPLINKLKDDGHLCIVVPWEDASTWISAANESGYYNHHRLDVYSFEEDVVAIRCLLHFTAVLCTPAIRRLVLYAKDKTYTTEYLTMSGIQSS